MKKIASIKSTFLLVAMLASVLLASVLVISCSEDDPVDPTTQRAINYISQNNTAIFKQELTENGTSNDLGDMKRELISAKNKIYTYKYSPVLSGTSFDEVLTFDGNKIWTSFTQSVQILKQDVKIDLKKIPIMDLDISGGQQYLDTTLKVKMDLKEWLDSEGNDAIEMNVDIRITSKLVPKADETLLIKATSFTAKVFINTITFEARTNDPTLQALKPERNNVLIAAGSFDIANWFTEENTLGLIYHSETTTIDELIKTIFVRTMKDFVINN